MAFVVVTGEDGAATTDLLRRLHRGEQVLDGLPAGATHLLDEPPGTEWLPADVVGRDRGALPELTLLRAEHLAGRPMGTLSGGERQRVRLAAALGSAAPVLLLDEGLGYLDLWGVVHVLTVLQEQSLTGRTVVLVAKGERRAAVAADRVLAT